MNRQEMRELDAWIAEYGMGIEVKRVGDEPYDANAVLGKAFVIGEIPRYSEESDALALVKREIERRGWSWQVHSPTHSNGYYWFAIFAAPDHALAQTIRKIGEEIAETEEIAGCLAFKRAVEATNGKTPVDECPAGPATDAAVAEALGHFVVWRTDIDRWFIASDGDASEQGFKHGLFWESSEGKVISYCLEMPKYSTDIAEAWDAARKKLGSNLAYLKVIDYGYSALCVISRLADVAEKSFDDYEAWAKTVPHAISRAILKASGIEEVEIGENQANA